MKYILLDLEKKIHESNANIKIQRYQKCIKVDFLEVY